jgi:hypothetical protein
MNLSDDDSDDDMDMCYMLAALIEEGESEKVPYAARKLPLITGIQWVEERMKNPKKFLQVFSNEEVSFYNIA